MRGHVALSRRAIPARRNPIQSGDPAPRSEDEKVSRNAHGLFSQMSKQRWIWIGGWGIPPTWLRGEVEAALPFATHTVVPPTPGVVATIDWSEFDRAAGYSFGAFLLLKEAEMVALPAVLLAPFFAYPAEAGLGGNIRLTQIRFLARWLTKDPLAALNDFYERAGLELKKPAELPYPLENLEWGLEQLAKVRAPTRLPETWKGLIGDRDPLLDASALLLAEPRLNVVPEAGHHPRALLQGVRLR